MAGLVKLVSAHNRNLTRGAKRIITIDDPEFEQYGKVVDAKTIPPLEENLSVALAGDVKTAIAANKIGYVPDVYAIIEDMLFKVKTENGTKVLTQVDRGEKYRTFLKTHFKGMPAQIGLCYGRDTVWTLNAGLEDHLDPYYTRLGNIKTTIGSPEIIWNESSQSNLLILGKAGDIHDIDCKPTLDAKTCTAVLMPGTARTGKAVMLSQGTEHLNPKGFEVMSRIYLLWQTNWELDIATLREMQKRDPIYVAQLRRALTTPGGGFYDKGPGPVTAGRISNPRYSFLRIH